MPADAEPFAKADLEEALRALASTIAKCEKVHPKLRPGTAQHTLLTRRLDALRIATALIERELAGRRAARPRRRSAARPRPTAAPARRGPTRRGAAKSSGRGRRRGR